VATENERTIVEASAHLAVGIRAIAIAGGCAIAMLLLGWERGSCFVWLVMLLVLLQGWVSVLGGLFVRSNRRGSRLWKHIGVLLVIPMLFYLGSFFRLVDLRARLVVALTGGQDKLQAWAVGLLNGPRDHLEYDGWKQWAVPQGVWSEQVRRLKPHGVCIEPVFDGGGEAVVLSYGGGFLHWYIVMGWLGSRPDPNLSDPNTDSWWLRWADGIYNWQR